MSRISAKPVQAATRKLSFDGHFLVEQNCPALGQLIHELPISIGKRHERWHYTGMRETTVQIDRAGRVMLPKQLRDRFRLRGGDTLAIEVLGDAIELRPTQGAGQLKRINGVLVFSGPRQISAGGDVVMESREERIAGVILKRVLELLKGP